MCGYVPCELVGGGPWMLRVHCGGGHGGWEMHIQGYVRREDASPESRQLSVFFFIITHLNH